MATHYETLGVAPTASAEEIRRAYRGLARRLHPDRHLGSSPEEAACADRRMREVNVAWRVLSDPAAKERYDLELALARASSERPPAPARPGPAPSTAAGRPAGPPRQPPGARAGTPHARVEVAPGEGLVTAIVRGLPWVVVIAVLGAIFVFTAFAAGRSDSDATTERSLLPTASVGDCVRFRSPTRLALVECSAPNDGEIIEKVPTGRPCSPGTLSRYLPDEGLYACIRL